VGASDATGTHYEVDLLDWAKDIVAGTIPHNYGLLMQSNNTTQSKSWHNRGGTDELRPYYEITFVTTPIIYDSTPATGSVGDTITISGVGFKPEATDPTVTIGGEAATIVSATDTEIVLTAPAYGDIVVTNSDAEDDTLANGFTVPAASGGGGSESGFRPATRPAYRKGYRGAYR
jgi:hypothetical protein